MQVWVSVIAAADRFRERFKLRSRVAPVRLSGRVQDLRMFAEPRQDFPESAVNGGRAFRAAEEEDRRKLGIQPKPGERVFAADGGQRRSRRVTRDGDVRAFRKIAATFFGDDGYPVGDFTQRAQRDGRLDIRNEDDLSPEKSGQRDRKADATQIGRASCRERV